MKQPYIDWTRNDLYSKLISQAKEFGISETLVHRACYDYRWEPSIDFNGCNLVQDERHPFLPCFLHDWRWITKQNTKTADIEFKDNLIKAGFTKFRATKFYIAVRLGWNLYYRWI